MDASQAKVGVRVRSLRPFSAVPKGTEGVIDEDYTTGVMVAWDLSDWPLPKGYEIYRPILKTDILRDGFDKETELHFLEIVEDRGETIEEVLDGLATFNEAFKRHFG